MAELTDNTEEISLWRTLHDGSIESISSDLLARNLTIVVDTLYHWEFHKLSRETRFEVICEGVRIVEAFTFTPWPGAAEPRQGTPNEKAEEERRRNFEKGLLESLSWREVVAEIEGEEDYEILRPEIIAESTSGESLRLEILSYPNFNYREVRIHAEQIRFFLAKQELSLQEFQQFGDAYWNDFAARATH